MQNKQQETKPNKQLQPNKTNSRQPGQTNQQAKQTTATKPNKQQ
jgi:hypothetical protein